MAQAASSPTKRVVTAKQSRTAIEHTTESIYVLIVVNTFSMHATGQSKTLSKGLVLCTALGVLYLRHLFCQGERPLRCYACLLQRQSPTEAAVVAVCAI